MSLDDRVRIGVVAGDPLRSLGLETILEEAAGVLPVPLQLPELMAGDAAELAVAVVDSGCVDDMPGLVLTLRRQWPELRVVVIGESADPDHVQAVIGAGAKGYLPSTANEAEIRMALHVVLDDSVWAPRKVLARLLDAGGVKPVGELDEDAVSDRMTPRERDVLDLLLQGQGNKQIAEAMGVDTVTVKAHLGRMMRKAGANNRVELTLKAMREKAADSRFGRDG